MEIAASPKTPFHKDDRHDDGHPMRLPEKPMPSKSNGSHNRRPAILYLCSSWPCGRAFGGQLRALHIGRALKQIGSVTVQVVGSEADDADAKRRTEEEFGSEPAICPQTRPNRTVFEKLRWAFDPRYLNVHGYAASLPDRERLVSCFGKYDLVWVLNSRTPNLLNQWSWPNAHLDMDDVPSTYLRGVSLNGTSIRARWKASVQRFLMKRRELLFKERFTTLSVCSEDDRRYLGGDDNIHVIPNGFERPVSIPVPNPATNPPRLGFIGLYSYAPNQDGVRWFLDHCWPAIRREVPGIRFRLVGKDTDRALRPGDLDVDVLGYVDDPATEIATWSGMIIPIRFGAGTRIKIADAFSRKCPVVATPLGAFGYEVEHGRHLLLAETPGAFVQACVALARDRISASAMAERAWQDFLEKWTWAAIAPRVWCAAEDTMRRSATVDKPAPV
jgi:polysaccharide biosynthesis protein PslH